MRSQTCCLWRIKKSGFVKDLIRKQVRITERFCEIAPTKFIVIFFLAPSFSCIFSSRSNLYAPPPLPNFLTQTNALNMSTTQCVSNHNFPGIFVWLFWLLHRRLRPRWKRRMKLQHLHTLEYVRLGTVRLVGGGY